MNIEIYYFSGTGNSLHIANELQKRIPEAKLIPIVSLLRKDFIKTEATTIGFVFPIHLAMAPAPVINFIKKLDLKSAEYIFAVATRAGSQHRAFIDLEKILKNKDKSLDSYFNLNMASNDPKFESWHKATEEEIADLETDVQKKLDYIKDIILNKDIFHEKDTEYTVKMPLFPILSFFLPFLNKMYNIEFYSNQKCISCGTCEKVCLSGKIKKVDRKPEWQDAVNCFICHACLNYCPKKAIQIKSTRTLKSHTEVNDRYSHPYASADNIANQKNN